MVKCISGICVSSKRHQISSSHNSTKSYTLNWFTLDWFKTHSVSFNLQSDRNSLCWSHACDLSKQWSPPLSFSKCSVNGLFFSPAANRLEHELWVVVPRPRPSASHRELNSSIPPAPPIDQSAETRKSFIRFEDKHIKKKKNKSITEDRVSVQVNSGTNCSPQVTVTAGGCDSLGKKNNVYCLSGNKSDEMSDSSASWESK